MVSASLVTVVWDIFGHLVQFARRSKQVLCKRGRGAVRVLQANLSKEGAEAEAKENSSISRIQRILEIIVSLVFRP